MTTTTITSREFNQDVSAAKKAARRGPVVITDRGKPAHVLITIERYQVLTSGTASMVDLLALPGVEDVAFELGRVDPRLHAADLE